MNENMPDPELRFGLEMRRIRKALHDGLCQELTGIAFHCKVLENKVLKGQALQPEDLAAVHKLVNQTIENARGLVRSLQPPPIPEEETQQENV